MGVSRIKLVVAAVVALAFNIALQGQPEAIVQPVPNAQAQYRNNVRLIAHML
jgi:hypothetical protein